MLNTSYFAKVNQIKNPVVAITSRKPPFFNGSVYSPLSPSPRLIHRYKNNEINEEDYIDIYFNETLKNLNPEKTYQDIINTYGQNAVLLCFENPQKFCHRHVVREWFKIHRLNVEELKL